MKQMIIVLITGLIILNCHGLQAAEKSGREIMEMVESREDGEDRSAEMKMILINQRGRTRERRIKSFSKEYGEDIRQVMLFEEPADVRGTGFLSWEYEDSSREDDRWLYMPALRKVRRISGSSSSDYFMGSDFTYDDMGDNNIDDYEYELLRTENMEGLDCWVVRSVPLLDKADYSHKILWIRQDVKMTVRVEFYDAVGLLKVLKMIEIKEIDNIWTATRLEMENLREKHQTILEFSNVNYNQDLKDNLFTVGAIQRGRF